MTEEKTQLEKLGLNLRGSQADFLQYLSVAADVEVSEIFRQLIDLAGLPDAEQYSASLDKFAIQYSKNPSIGGSGARKWRRISIYLDAGHIRRLHSLAAQEKVSESSVLRHLLAGYMERSNFLSDNRHAQSVGSFQRYLLQEKTKLSLVVMVLLAGAMVALVVSLSGGSSIRVGPHWAGTPASLIFDHHTHTRRSDGELSSGDLVDLAVRNGCDAMVISDHSDAPGTVSDEQMQELWDLRGNNPDFLLFSGMELNMPSYGGREHAGLIAAPEVESGTLQLLRDLAELGIKRAQNSGASSVFDRQLLQMIANHQSLSGNLLLVYNHPSREDTDIAENLSDLTKWNTQTAVFAAIEGAPGHQNAPVTGSYEEPYLTEDGWDPVVAQVGGAWDELLSQGHQLWGALASSDYHNDGLDKAPCAFARTHLSVPEWSYRGVLRALKTGTFWADHGRILNQLRFSVSLDGLEQAAYPGFIVNVGDRDSQAVVTLSIERGGGSMGQPLTVEIIGNCSSGTAEILSAQEIAPADSTFTTLVPLQATGQDGASCSLRARVRLSRAPSPDYMAYTNPIRLILN